MGVNMNFIGKKIKILFSLIGVAINMSAQAQSSLGADVQLPEIEDQLNQTPISKEIKSNLAYPKIYQTVSEEELISALQNNTLDQLLLKKGVLIKRLSADSTVCEKCSTGGGN